MKAILRHLNMPRWRLHFREMGSRANSHVSGKAGLKEDMESLSPLAGIQAYAPTAITVPVTGTCPLRPHLSLFFNTAPHTQTAPGNHRLGEHSSN